MVWVVIALGISCFIAVWITKKSRQIDVYVVGDIMYFREHDQWYKMSSDETNLHNAQKIDIMESPIEEVMLLMQLLEM